MVPPDDKPLVSVILPVFNGQEFVLDAVNSALAQTWQNLEVIVVDDGSTDDTFPLLKARAGRDPRLSILRQTNGGVARARNRALAQARGDFIAPLDADDLWEPTKIERQMTRLAECGDETAIVYTGWVWIDSEGFILDRSPRWTVAGQVFDRLLQINFTGNASVPLFRRRALEQVGGYNPALADAGAGGCEDWEVVLRIARAYQVAVVPDALVGYRRRPGSMSTACRTMRLSRDYVIEGLKRRGPAISHDLLRRSERQFFLYLAGLAFWSGNVREAISWGLRAGIRLPLAVLPYVLAMIGRRALARFSLLRGHKPQRMQPGVHLNQALLPSAHIDYAYIYRRHESAFTTGPEHTTRGEQVG